MTKHDDFQTRLKVAINNAILDAGTVEGTNDVALTNTDVVEALLEIAGFYASVHGFEAYSRKELAFKHALTIQAHIQKYERLRKEGKIPVKVVPRSKIN